jgi:hypothetical protein
MSMFLPPPMTPEYTPEVLEKVELLRRLEAFHSRMIAETLLHPANFHKPHRTIQ